MTSAGPPTHNATPLILIRNASRIAVNRVIPDDCFDPGCSLSTRFRSHGGCSKKTNEYTLQTISTVHSEMALSLTIPMQCPCRHSIISLSEHAKVGVDDAEMKILAYIRSYVAKLYICKCRDYNTLLPVISSLASSHGGRF